MLVVVTTVQCKKKNKKEEQIDEFDKATLLQNVSENLILFSYNDFYSALLNLEQSYSTFSGDKTSDNFEILKSAWKTANEKFQYAKIYEFGPSMNISFRSSEGAFPCDTAKILNNISTGTYTLGSLDNIDAIGFDALDFLLFRSTALSDLTSSSNYLSYGSNLIQKIKTETSYVINNWSSYKATFNAGTGTESTSGFSYLVNEFCKDFELIKNAKLGIPIGKQSLGIQMPEFVEARRSAYSLELMKHSLIASQALFNGKTGVGFDDYLTALEKSNLATQINNKYAEILTLINSLSGSLELNINSNPGTLDAIYTKMAELVVLIKTDMTSSFGVLITYQDNDGD